MHIAARSGLLSCVALLQLALPARAETGAPAPGLPADSVAPQPTTAQPPPETLPPEPSNGRSEPATRRPAQPPTAPASNPTSPERPFSAHLLQVHLTNGWSPIQITRDGAESPDLVAEVTGSDQAANLVRSGQSQVSTGTVLMICGLVVEVGTLIIAIPLVNNNPNPSSQQAAQLAGGLAAGVIVGAVVEIAGAFIRMNGYHDIVEAVNTYNADLVDGHLVAPPTVAVPAR
jgi:hypothetical protein